MTKSYVATKIDVHQFEYNCSECGKPHYHGSNGNTTNEWNIEVRIAEKIP